MGFSARFWVVYAIASFLEVVIKKRDSVAESFPQVASIKAAVPTVSKGMREASVSVRYGGIRGDSRRHIEQLALQNGCSSCAGRRCRRCL